MLALDHETCRAPYLAHGLDETTFVCHAFGRMMSGYGLTPPVMIDFSGERCARSVHGLSTMSRTELEVHLESTARASASVVLVRPRTPKPERTPRWKQRRDRWR